MSRVVQSLNGKGSKFTNQIATISRAQGHPADGAPRTTRNTRHTTHMTKSTLSHRVLIAFARPTNIGTIVTSKLYGKYGKYNVSTRKPIHNDNVQPRIHFMPSIVVLLKQDHFCLLPLTGGERGVHCCSWWPLWTSYLMQIITTVIEPNRPIKIRDFTLCYLRRGAFPDPCLYGHFVLFWYVASMVKVWRDLLGTPCIYTGCPVIDGSPVVCR